MDENQAEQQPLNNEHKEYEINPTGKTTEDLLYNLKHKTEEIKEQNEKELKAVEKPLEAKEPEKTEEKPKESVESAELAKTYKCKYADKELDLPSDTKFELSTKSGKKIEVTLEELKSDVFGKQEISRKMTELDKEKKQYKRDLEFAKGLSSKLLESQGPEKIEAVLHELHKYDPKIKDALLQYQQKLYDEVINVTKLSPEEREKYWLQQENHNLKQTREYDTELQQRQAAEVYVSQREAEIMEKHGLDDNGLKQLGQAIIQDLQQTRRLDQTSVDQFYEMIEGRIQQQSYMKESFEAYKSLYPDKADKIAAMGTITDPEDTNVKELLELFQLKQLRPGMTKAELASKAKALFGEPKSKEDEANEKAKESRAPTILEKSNKLNKNKNQSSGDPVADFSAKYGRPAGY